MHFHHVARGAGFVRHNRHVALGERIQQAGFAGIGGAKNHDLQPVANFLAQPPVIQQGGEFAAECIHSRGGLGQHRFGDVFVREINIGLE